MITLVIVKITVLEIKIKQPFLAKYILPTFLNYKRNFINFRYELMMKCWEKPDTRPHFADIVDHHEALMDDDYIVLSDYEESDYGWLESYTTDERR